MAFISNTELAKVGDAIQHERNRANNWMAKAKEGLQVDKTVAVLETVGAAGAVGALRGKLEDPNGAWNIPGTSIDWESVIGVTLVAGSYFADSKEGKKMGLGKAGGHMLNAGMGVLAHYVGQISRNSIKTGNFTLIGSNVSHALSGY